MKTDALHASIRRLQEQDLLERDHEDVVKELLLRLGTDKAAIQFGKGRIDVRVLGKSGKTAAVFEVKTTIATRSQCDAAIRQGMDYAGRTGAEIVVVSDGDRYEVYDRRKGRDYASMLCGAFRLTDFRETDAALLDLLRPDALLNF